MRRSAGGCSNSDRSLPEIYERIGPHLTLVGISTKWWSRSPDAKCTCGVPLTAKARVSKFSFSPNATRSRHCGWRRESPYLAQATSETQATLQHETERL